MSDTLLKFLAGTFLIETPIIFSWVIFLFASGITIFQNHPFLKSRPHTRTARVDDPSACAERSRSAQRNSPFGVEVYSWLIGVVVVFKFFISFLETFLQYYVWEKNPFTKILLTQPLSEKVPNEIIPGFIRKILFDNPHGAFLYYAWGHFFLNVFLSVFSAIVFYFLLVLLRKYRERFFGDGEVALGTLMGLIVGWPNIVLFVPAALILTVLFSIVRRIVWGKNYTTLGWSFLVSGFVILVFGKFLSDLFHLRVLG